MNPVGVTKNRILDIWDAVFVLSLYWKSYCPYVITHVLGGSFFSIYIQKVAKGMRSSGFGARFAGWEGFETDRNS